MNNHANLQATDESKVLLETSLATYQDCMSRIWKELYRLSSNLFILERLLQFRSDLFLELQKTDFLSLVTVNLTHDSCLITTKLVTDTGNKLTMSRFHNWLKKNIRPEYSASFDESFRKSGYKKTVQAVRQKIEPLRDTYLAHLIIDDQMHPPPETEIAYQELRDICDQLVEYFNLHSFGCEYKMLPLGYDPTVIHPSGVDKRPDIEYVLDLIVQDSDLYNMPEKSPYWQVFKDTLPSGTVDVINQYRQKFGKQPSL